MEAIKLREEVDRRAVHTNHTPETRRQDEEIQNLLPGCEVVRVGAGRWCIFAAPEDDYAVAQLMSPDAGGNKWWFTSRTIQNKRYSEGSLEFYTMTSNTMDALLAKGRKHVVPLSPTEMFKHSISYFRQAFERQTGHIDRAVRDATEAFCKGAAVGREALDYLISGSTLATAALEEMPDTVQAAVAAYATAVRAFEEGPTHEVNCAFFFSHGRDYWVVPVPVTHDAYIMRYACRVSDTIPANPTIKDMSAMPEEIRDALSVLNITDINQCVPGVGMRVSKEAAYVFYK